MIGEKFKELIIKTAKRHRSRVILALDKIKITTNNEEKEIYKQEILNIAKETAPYLAAIKIGYPLVLATDLSFVTEIKIVSNLPIIGDFKIADIGYTNSLIAELAFTSGIDAVIAHAFVGKDSVDAIINTAKKYGDKGVFLLPLMSHPGAKMFMKPLMRELVELCIIEDVTGVIAPATRLDDLKRIRELIGEERLILAPGVGAQGARPGSAIKEGANFEIIGRAIYNAESPSKAVKFFAEKTWRI